MMNPNALAPLCEGRVDTVWSYVNSLFELGWVFVLASFVVAILTALVALWNAVNAPTKINNGLVPDPVKALDSLKALITALVDAPAWFAMFLAGVALIWLATSIVPGICDASAHPMPPTKAQSETVN
jgi:hypothetical protein